MCHILILATSPILTLSLDHFNLRGADRALGFPSFSVTSVGSHCTVLIRNSLNFVECGWHHSPVSKQISRGYFVFVSLMSFSHFQFWEKLQKCIHKLPSLPKVCGNQHGFLIPLHVLNSYLNILGKCVKNRPFQIHNLKRTCVWMYTRSHHLVPCWFNYTLLTRMFKILMQTKSGISTQWNSIQPQKGVKYNMDETHKHCTKWKKRDKKNTYYMVSLIWNVHYTNL